MLFDHSLVMITGDGRQTLWQQVVVGITTFDGHDIALLSKVIDRLNQQKLNAAIARLGDLRNAVWLVSFLLFCFRARHTTNSSDLFD